MGRSERRRVLGWTDLPSLHFGHPVPRILALSVAHVSVNGDGPLRGYAAAPGALTNAAHASRAGLGETAGPHRLQRPLEEPGTPTRAHWQEASFGRFVLRAARVLQSFIRLLNRISHQY